ncbi:hypothetical protein JCM15548_13070 [Geofilum rubicundum JCM 15548]|uniref:DUF3078 domain-containing protein n=1 Tax=Geofilum rubicundum JCM 15548 TaxID=1236989 RepID=A0A0E9LZT2_9BACT|nr:hypothetical protein JCM15548_13070 [Geofilum rubicundum JCM 15548]
MLFFGVVQSSNGQTAVDRYFPDYVLPEWWFEPMGAEWLHDQMLEEVRRQNEMKKLKGARIPFYSTPFLAGAEVLDVNVSRAHIVSHLQQRPLNVYHLEYALHKPGGYWAHALPNIYKSPPVPDLMDFDSEVEKTPFDRYQNFLKHPGRADTLHAQMMKEGFSRERFMRQLYHTSPSVVQYDWYELPDPPQVFGEASRLSRNTSSRSIEHLFNAREINRPGRLEKVDMAKRPWVFSGTEHVQFSQAYLKNWVKGGQQSLALLSDLRFSAVYKDENTQWENNLIHKVGFIDSDGSKSRINDDLIEISSKYGVNASKKWYYSLLFNFRTQFFQGYSSKDVDKETPISAFMAPAFWSLAAGMDYKTKNFTLMLSPLTSRVTMVLDTATIDQTRYSIPEDKKSMFFMGGSLQNNIKWDITKDIKLSSAMNVFYDYFEKEDKVQAEWDIILDMKINVFLTTRIVTNFRYFESESSKIQARENLSIAFRLHF